ncbi:cyclopropane-fatty-acyl-phospholipid synthase family protein [Sphingomonas daechungensis]|uniref:cyclopropane-fatty-acyl-phospholipid synthase family protein n=1 Tax=Sphingomonas daechungensis TaxID=1176646 RepID=UPI0031ED3D4D
MSTRGAHLVHGDRGFMTGGSLIARAIAPGVDTLIDAVHRKMERGGIDATLPDGSRRRVGFHRPGPAARLEVKSWMALVRLGFSGSVGWYKAWDLGEWTSPDLVPLFELFSLNAVTLGDVGRAKGPARWLNSLAHRLRDNAPQRAKANIAAHYDLGNDFYSAWLDTTMTYSSARFAGTDEPLETSQLRKVHALLDRLEIKPGSRLLEIGSGWGTLAIEAGKRGANVVGLTLSEEQKAWADRRIAEAGLSDKVEIRLQDYREIAEQFDAIASVEMVEAVGQRWWPAYLDCIARNLRPGGRAALQFISMDGRLFDRYARNADFIQTYIFPGGQLLNEPRFEALAQERALSWEGREGFRSDYAETLKHWRERYEAAIATGRLNGFGEQFHRLWRYYLMYCEGGFRGGAIDVAQVTMVKG